LLSIATGQVEHVTVSTKPEALDAWWRDLQSAHPDTRLLVAFERRARGHV
jgi:hypothetical protein